MLSFSKNVALELANVTLSVHLENAQFFTLGAT